VTEIAALFVVLNAIAVLLLPRRWAALPLIAGACYVTLGQAIELGPLTFTAIRILVAAAALRVLVRREQLTGGMNALDWLMVMWAVWAVVSSVFHENPSAALTFRLGRVYNACGIYFLLRIFCTSVEDVIRLCVITAILLTPVAVEMLHEKQGSANVFSVLGGTGGGPRVREDRIRAFGPFAHPILAGTVGAVSLPLMFGIWRYRRKTASLGIFACLTMIVSSASSGPILSTAAGVGALMIWRFRHRMRGIRWLGILAYIVLDLVMKAPPYYLIGRIDLAGGSTGWHRARLIDSSFQHLDEWWLGGTDVTRHWMTTGVSWSADHTDITNHYLHMGVVGGLPLMLLFIAVLATGFAFVGARLRDESDGAPHRQFFLWALGSSLFAHAATFVSVSYFDQSFLFLYLSLGAIGSVRAEKVAMSALPVSGVQRRPPIRIAAGSRALHRPLRHAGRPPAALPGTVAPGRS
jgi:hypothetical protein